MRKTQLPETAIATAIVAVFTLIVRVPTPYGGYISLCETAIVFSSLVFSPIVSLLASGLGTAFADLLGGYPQWAVISFIVHGGESYVISLLCKKGKSVFILSLIISLIIMVAGYYILTVLFSLTTAAEALIEAFANTLQFAFGTAFALPLYKAVRKAYPDIDSFRLGM